MYHVQVIKCKIQFAQENSKIAVILTPDIKAQTRLTFYARMHFLWKCVPHNFYDRNARQARFVIIFLACALLEQTRCVLKHWWTIQIH